MKLRCKKCHSLLGKLENGWVEIIGKTNFSSNGEEFKIVCKCSEVNIFSIK